MGLVTILFPLIAALGAINFKKGKFEGPKTVRDMDIDMDMGQYIFEKDMRKNYKCINTYYYIMNIIILLLKCLKKKKFQTPKITIKV